MTTPRRQLGLTMIELIVVLALVAIIAALLLPALSKGGSDRRRLNCTSNLKQIGLGFRLWANDHGGKFPWQRSTNDGGTIEYAETRGMFRHFLAASNELNSPKILSCYADTDHTRTPFWTNLANTNISYFLGLHDGTEGLLAGDRFLSTNKQVLAGMITITKPKGMRWAVGGHDGSGSLVYTDGSARLLKSRQLQTAITNFPVSLVFP